MMKCFKFKLNIYQKSEHASECWCLTIFLILHTTLILVTSEVIHSATSADKKVPSASLKE